VLVFFYSSGLPSEVSHDYPNLISIFVDYSRTMPRLLFRTGGSHIGNRAA